jgi:hypothetical protein
MKRILVLVLALCAISADVIANLDAMGGTPPGCC